MADTNTVPIPASIPDAEALIASFIIDEDGLSAAMFADYDSEYEALYQFGLICEEYMSWTLDHLVAQVKITDPFLSVQYLYPIIHILAQAPRVRRSTLRGLYEDLDAIAYAPQVSLGDTHRREKAKAVLNLVIEYPREKIIRN